MVITPYIYNGEVIGNNSEEAARYLIVNDEMVAREAVKIWLDSMSHDNLTYLIAFGTLLDNTWEDLVHFGIEDNGSEIGCLWFDRVPKSVIYNRKPGNYRKKHGISSFKRNRE